MFVSCVVYDVYDVVQVGNLLSGQRRYGLRGMSSVLRYCYSSSSNGTLQAQVDWAEIRSNLCELTTAKQDAKEAKHLRDLFTQSCWLLETLREMGVPPGRDHFGYYGKEPPCIINSSLTGRFRRVRRLSYVVKVGEWWIREWEGIVAFMSKGNPRFRYCMPHDPIMTPILLKTPATPRPQDMVTYVQPLVFTQSVIGFR